MRFEFKECCASQHCRSEANAKYEEVMVTLHSQKALDEFYSPPFQRLLKGEG